MHLFKVPVSKCYTRSGRLFGYIVVLAASINEAIEIVKAAMEYKGDRPKPSRALYRHHLSGWGCLQTTDPRIHWTGEGHGDYIDFSFRIEGAHEVEKANSQSPRDPELVLRAEEAGFISHKEI